MGTQGTRRGQTKHTQKNNTTQKTKKMSNTDPHHNTSSSVKKIKLRGNNSM